MLNVVVTLQQYCGNVLIMSESDFVTTSETDVGTTLIFDRVTTLWQRQQRRCASWDAMFFSSLRTITSSPSFNFRSLELCTRFCCSLLSHMYPFIKRDDAPSLQERMYLAWSFRSQALAFPASPSNPKSSCARITKLGVRIGVWILCVNGVRIGVWMAGYWVWSQYLIYDTFGFLSR